MSLCQSPALVWHTYPLGLLGADQSGGNRAGSATLREVAQWLPHMASLGADTLLMGPIFSSLSHGYDTVDHRDIDDRLGTIGDFDALVAAASVQGVGVVLDGAFAYASRAFWRLSDPAEARASWFLRDAGGQLVPWRVDSLVTPDYAAPGYQAYVADVMVSWLNRGIRGWRLDSSWSVPAGFWRKVLTRVRRSHPQAWLLGQVFDDDLPPVVNAATYSSVTEYALMHGTREWLAGGTAEGMAATLRLHQRNSTRNPVQTFLGNHDYARLADTIAADLLPAAFSILLTLPGIPAIYYGDEIAITSTWDRDGADALLRPPMAVHDVTRLPGLRLDPLPTTQALGSFRKASPWLTHAALDGIRIHRGALTYQVAGDGRAIRVYVNPTATAVTFNTDEAPILGAANLQPTHGVEVGPRSWAILGDTQPNITAATTTFP